MPEIDVGVSFQRGEDATTPLRTLPKYSFDHMKNDIPHVREMAGRCDPAGHTNHV